MQEDQCQQRAAIIQSIRDNGGEKAFLLGQTSIFVIECLVKLVAGGILEGIDNPDPTARTYRLKAK